MVKLLRRCSGYAINANALEILISFHYPMNRLLSVVRSRTDKIIELSRAALTVPRYGESNRLVGVD